MNHSNSTASLNTLMNPASVAVIGASDNPAKIGGRPIHYLLTRGYQGAVYPVNPRGGQIQGIPAFKTIKSLPKAPDLAIVALPVALVGDAIVDLAALGAKTAVIFSAGFAEMGAEGEALQQNLKTLARKSGMRIIGPNCLGIFNAHNGLFATFSTSLEQNTPTGGNVSIASQSGAYASHLSMLATQRQMAIGYWFSTGNECDVEVSECIHWLAERDEVDVIIAYAEGIRDGRRLRLAFEAAHNNRKTIVFVKVGGSIVGAQAAKSHTASLTGSDDVFNALCRQYGVYRAHDTEEALDVAYAAAAGRFPKTRRTGLMTVSGGVGIHMADCASELRLDVAPMPQAAEAALRNILPYAGTTNPVDVTAQVINEVALFEEFLAIILDEGNYDLIIIYFTFVAALENMIGPMTQALKGVTDRFPDRVVLLSNIADATTVSRDEQTTCLVIDDPWRAVRAGAALADLHEKRQLPLPSLTRASKEPLPGPHSDEFDAKCLLKTLGFPVTREHLVNDTASALKAGDTLGWPVVLKIVSPDIQHKTEVGGVKLQVTREKAEADYTTLIQSVTSKRPEADLRGVLVSETVADGVEVIIGIDSDPVFGPVVMFGLGGVFVEVFEDVVFSHAPFDAGEASRMIDTTRAGRLLDGVRGNKPADRKALVDLLVIVSAFADRYRDSIKSVDLNPVVVREAGQGVVILDTVIDSQPQ